MMHLLLRHKNSRPVFSKLLVTCNPIKASKLIEHGCRSHFELNLTSIWFVLQFSKRSPLVRRDTVSKLVTCIVKYFSSQTISNHGIYNLATYNEPLIWLF